MTSWLGAHITSHCTAPYSNSHISNSIQVKALRAGADVVVATPGRLEDLVQEGSCRLSGVTYLVLDEADRMLDLGFEPHIRSAQVLATG